MSEQENVPTSTHDNWKRFTDLSKDDNFVTRLAELMVDCGLPLKLTQSVSNIEEVGDAYVNLYADFLDRHLVVRAIAKVKTLKSTYKRLPDVDEQTLLTKYRKANDLFRSRRQSDFQEPDPERMKLIEAVDMAHPYAPIVVALIITDDSTLSEKDKDSLSLPPVPRELMDQGVDVTDMALITIVEVLRWVAHNSFLDGLGRLMKDFDLGPEWRIPLFMYAVTEEMVCIPRDDTESKVSLSIPAKHHDYIKSLADLMRKGEKIEADMTFRYQVPLRTKKTIIPLRLPPGTKWHNITIKFEDGQNVTITAPSFRESRNYKEMGFQNDKNLMPNKQWDMLYALAGQHGEVSVIDRKAALGLKKRKQLLSNTLREFFQIDDDPFFPYKTAKAYKTKFMLIPD